MGGLIGWRKLTVGDRHWRIIWRTHTDVSGLLIVEIAEIWAIGARADSKIYKELTDRFSTMGFESQPGSPEMLDKKIKLETVKWAKAIKEAGMQPD